jgi:Uma2 family endonuclease
VDARLKLFTPTEYLAFERKSETKHEYFAGVIYPMAHANARHSLLIVNLICELATQLRKRPEQVYHCNMRLKVSKTGLYTYPDVFVVSGKPQFEGNESDILLNPVVIVEVLSKSTEAYDRGKKFQHYRTVDTLMEYLLVAQDSYHIEHYVRQADGQWLLSEATHLQETIHLPTIHCDLRLEDVYDKVELAPESLYLNGTQE